MSAYLSGPKLKAHREATGQTVEQIAVRTRRTVAFVTACELRGAYVSQSELGAIAHGLGVHPDDVKGTPPRLSIKGADLRSAMSEDHGQGGISGSERLAARLFPATGD